MTAIPGLLLLAGAIWLVSRLRPRDGKPGAALLRRPGADTAVALAITAAVALGGALLVGGIVDLWPAASVAHAQ